MSKKRKRNSQANAKNFEKILRESLDKELSCDEVKSLHASIKEYITTDAGGAEVLHKLVTKVFCNHRLKDAKRLKAIRVYDYTFLKSKDFRGIVCNRLRTSIQACCRGSADNASDISKDAVALELLLCVHRWDAAFGSIYPELRLVIRYYSESVRVLNADGLIVSAARRDEDLARRRLLYATCHRLLDSLPDYIASIESNISAAHEIFDILFPSFISAEPKAHLPAANEPPRQALAEEADSVEWEDGGVEEDIKTNPLNDNVAFTLSSAGLICADYTLDITVGVTAADIQTADNEILISTLRELTKAFQIHTLPKLSDWRALMGQTRQHIELDPLYSSIERVIMEVLPLHEECLINLKGRINEFIDSKSNNFFEL